MHRETIAKSFNETREDVIKFSEGNEVKKSTMSYEGPNTGYTFYLKEDGTIACQAHRIKLEGIRAFATLLGVNCLDSSNYRFEAEFDEVEIPKVSEENRKLALAYLAYLLSVVEEHFHNIQDGIAIDSDIWRELDLFIDNHCPSFEMFKNSFDEDNLTLGDITFRLRHKILSAIFSEVVSAAIKSSESVLILDHYKLGLSLK